MNKCDLAKEFEDIMELASQITSAIRFSAEDLGYSIAVKIINNDTVVISNAKCKSSIINSITKTLLSYARNIDDFIDMVCDDKSVIDFTDDELKRIPQELIGKVEKFNDTILNYNSYEEEECAAIKEKILSWINCKSCSGIRVYTSSLELVSFISKTFSNKRNSHVRMQMLAERGSELSSLFCGDEVPIIDTDYKCIPIELVAKEIFNEELVMVPIMSCSNDDATIINNYSVLINVLLNNMRVNVYMPGKLKDGCIISVGYSVTSNDSSIFVNINVNKEFKDHGYIENVVEPGLEKYGIDGTLISLFNLSQLILEKGWVF